MKACVSSLGNGGVTAALAAIVMSLPACGRSDSSDALEFRDEAATESATHGSWLTEQAARHADDMAFLDRLARRPAVPVGKHIDLVGTFFTRMRVITGRDGERIAFPPEYIVDRERLPAEASVRQAITGWSPFRGLTLVVECGPSGAATIRAVAAPESSANSSILRRDEREQRETLVATAQQSHDELEVVSRGLIGYADPPALSCVFSDLRDKPLAERVTLATNDPSYCVMLCIDDDGTWYFLSGIAGVSDDAGKEPGGDR